MSAKVELATPNRPSSVLSSAVVLDADATIPGDRLRGPGGLDAPRRGADAASWARALDLLRGALVRDTSHVWIVAIALSLSSVALSLGLTADDHFQALAIRDQQAVAGVQRAPWDLYSYAKDASSISQLMDAGVYPWWSDASARISFFRPITSLSIWLDHQLWPNRPALMHLHSLAWFAALLWTVSSLYRRISRGAVVAGLALMVFAFDDARASTVGWLCNRNALIALVFGFGALLLHDSWRKLGDKRARLLAPLCLLLGLLAGEVALSVCGYLLAYALCLDVGSLRQRALSLLPYGAVLVGWHIVYKALGYGAIGSGLYIDPGQDILAFTSVVVDRLPLLLTAQFTGIFAEIGDGLPVLMPAAMPALLPLCLVCLGLLVLLFRPLWRHREVRFWAVGCVVSTLPVCGVSPTDRVLTATALGGAAIVSVFLVALVNKTYPHLNRLTRGAGVALALVHLVVAPILLPMRTKAVDHFETLLGEVDASVPHNAAVRTKTVVLLNPPVDPYGLYFPLYRASRDIPLPGRVRWLATGVSDLLVTRDDAFTLRIRPSDGFLSNSSQWALRDPKKPARLGDSVALAGVTFQVSALTPDARPQEVTVRFDEALDSPRFTWLQWGARAYVPFKPPAVGQAVVVPRVDLMGAMF